VSTAAKAFSNLSGTPSAEFLGSQRLKELGALVKTSLRF
jgi:hypothetical protein